MDMQQPSSLSAKQSAAVCAAQTGNQSILIQMELVHLRSTFGEEVASLALGDQSFWGVQRMSPYRIVGETVHWANYLATCPRCGGRGAVRDAQPMTCPVCLGSGSEAADGAIEIVTDMDAHPLDEDES
jgi:hypothetical protein